MAATAQAQAEAMKEAQCAGIAHAKANGDARAYKGRKPSYSRKQFESAQAMLGKSASVGEVARTTGLTRQTVYRIKDDPAGAEVSASQSSLYRAVNPRSSAGSEQGHGILSSVRIQQQRGREDLQTGQLTVLPASPQQ